MTIRSTLISIINTIVVVLSSLIAVAFTTVAERKTMASMQRRLGPNYVGVWGLLQAFADALKLLLKEVVSPTQANPILFYLGPIITLVFSLLGYGIVVLGPGLTLWDFNLGILYMLAVSSLSTYGILLAGWSANSKYAFLGSLRSTAQLIGYELILSSGIIIVVFLTGSLNFTQTIEYQRALWLLVPLIAVLYIFFMGSIAETNRPPFDLAEAESELVSGFMTEHSSVVFVFFFLAEYGSILLICIVNVMLFIGGYLYKYIDVTYYFNYVKDLFNNVTEQTYIISNINQDNTFILQFINYLFNFPFFEGFIYGFNLAIKSVLFIFTFIWVRASLPRIRFDQLMIYCWIILLPIVIAIIFITPSIMDLNQDPIINLQVLLFWPFFKGKSNTIQTKPLAHTYYKLPEFIQRLSYITFWGKRRNWLSNILSIILAALLYFFARFYLDSLFSFNLLDFNTFLNIKLSIYFILILIRCYIKHLIDTLFEGMPSQSEGITQKNDITSYNKPWIFIIRGESFNIVNTIFTAIIGTISIFIVRIYVIPYMEDLYNDFDFDLLMWVFSLSAKDIVVFFWMYINSGFISMDGNSINIVGNNTNSTNKVYKPIASNINYSNSSNNPNNNVTGSTSNDAGSNSNTTSGTSNNSTINTNNSNVPLATSTIPPYRHVGSDGNTDIYVQKGTEEHRLLEAMFNQNTNQAGPSASPTSGSVLLSFARLLTPTVIAYSGIEPTVISEGTVTRPRINPFGINPINNPGNRVLDLSNLGRYPLFPEGISIDTPSNHEVGSYYMPRQGVVYTTQRTGLEREIDMFYQDYNNAVRQNFTDQYAADRSVRNLLNSQRNNSTSSLDSYTSNNSQSANTNQQSDTQNASENNSSNNQSNSQNRNFSNSRSSSQNRNSSGNTR